jgi:hypothetical protein
VGKKSDKAKVGKKKLKRRPVDPAHGLLGALVLGQGEGVAGLCLAADVPLGEALRSLVDLQRFGLVEVTNGIPRPTVLGESTWRALAVPPPRRERRGDAGGDAHKDV